MSNQFPNISLQKTMCPFLNAYILKTLLFERPSLKIGGKVEWCSFVGLGGEAERASTFPRSTLSWSDSGQLWPSFSSTVRTSRHEDFWQISKIRSYETVKIVDVNLRGESIRAVCESFQPTRPLILRCHQGGDEGNIRQSFSTSTMTGELARHGTQPETLLVSAAFADLLRYPILARCTEHMVFSDSCAFFFFRSFPSVFASRRITNHPLLPGMVFPLRKFEIISLLISIQVLARLCRPQSNTAKKSA